MKRAGHQLRGLDEIVGLSRSLARLEATRPVRLVQLALEARFVGADSREREETIVEVPRQ
jgi:hypothetical protein